MDSDLVIDASTSLVDCAFKICTLFDRNGKTIVLTGGSAATVYSKEAYMSSDIDFILNFRGSTEAENAALVELGYIVGSTYRHKTNPVSIDFLREDISVGEKQVDSWSVLHNENLVLHILTPTDCVLDRLAGAIHWNDTSAVRQAALVAKEQQVDWDEVKRWCVSEHQTKGPLIFDDFLQLVQED